MTNNRHFRATALLIAMLCGTALSGCSSIALNGVPASRLPRWMLGEERASRQPINLIRLRQDPPAVYQLGPRDVLGIYIQGVLGSEELPPEVHFPVDSKLPPALGYPIPIREDGTLALPLISPVKISGMTLSQAEKEVRDTYLREGILVPGRDRILVTLMRKRTYQVVVVREDLGSGQAAQQGILIAGPSKRGNAFTVDLPAYENDVMHALAQTGGLPGLDAKNEVLILRGTFADAQSRDGIINEMVNVGPYNGADDWVRKNPNIIRIPLRAEPGRPLTQLTEDDIILNTGDIVFIETREREVFYTGGVLQGREIPLPRDYDLDVLAAISLAGGTVSAGATQGSLANNGQFGGGGMRSALPPTQIVVLRKLPNGSTIPIKINLNRALVDSSQRILVQPGDYVMLQYTPAELVANMILGSISFQYFINRIQ
ncbi:MAG: polysaccharide biosynthesis/export family protein [Planctomycetales bacterium]|nr:polysaccharide biosynthesis/export family protein [Planctomycetales bacterium]MBN8624357.1 polysaccharide biosynthesis/export family protein [Planctomycetota bacterium]